MPFLVLLSHIRFGKAHIINCLLPVRCYIAAVTTRYQLLPHVLVVNAQHVFGPLPHILFAPALPWMVRRYLYERFRNRLFLRKRHHLASPETSGIGLSGLGNR